MLPILMNEVTAIFEAAFKFAVIEQHRHDFFRVELLREIAQMPVKYLVAVIDHDNPLCQRGDVIHVM